MNCREVSDLLPRHFDATLDADADAAFTEHASDCSCCRELVQTYGVVIALARLSRPEVPTDAPGES